MKQVTIISTDDYTELQAYTDGTYWNGWASVIFTKDQLIAWLSDSLYAFRFTDQNVIIYFEDEEVLPLIEFTDEQGNTLQGFNMNGYTFMYKSDL